MAKIWEPRLPEILRYWVDTILMEASDNLNDWETNFINNIEKQLDLGIKLTQSQEDKLESIYAEKTL